MLYPPLVAIVRSGIWQRRVRLLHDRRRASEGHSRRPARAPVAERQSDHHCGRRRPESCCLLLHQQFVCKDDLAGKRKVVGGKRKRLSVHDRRHLAQPAAVKGNGVNPEPLSSCCKPYIRLSVADDDRHFTAVDVNRVFTVGKYGTVIQCIRQVKQHQPS